MPGRPKSATEKAQIVSNKKSNVEEKAVIIYCEELKKPEKDRKGARTVCLEVEQEHFLRTGELIKICYNTIR